MPQKQKQYNGAMDSFFNLLFGQAKKKKPQVKPPKLTPGSAAEGLAGAMAAMLAQPATFVGDSAMSVVDFSLLDAKPVSFSLDKTNAVRFRNYGPGGDLEINLRDLPSFLKDPSGFVQSKIDAGKAERRFHSFFKGGSGTGEWIDHLLGMAYARRIGVRNITDQWNFGNAARAAPTTGQQETVKRMLNETIGLRAAYAVMLEDAARDLGKDVRDPSVVAEVDKRIRSGSGKEAQILSRAFDRGISRSRQGRQMEAFGTEGGTAYFSTALDKAKYSLAKEYTSGDEKRYNELLVLSSRSEEQTREFDLLTARRNAYQHYFGGYGAAGPGRVALTSAASDYLDRRHTIMEQIGSSETQKVINANSGRWKELDAKVKGGVALTSEERQIYTLLEIAKHGSGSAPMSAETEAVIASGTARRRDLIGRTQSRIDSDWATAWRSVSREIAGERRKAGLPVLSSDEMSGLERSFRAEYLAQYTTVSGVDHTIDGRISPTAYRRMYAQSLQQRAVFETDPAERLRLQQLAASIGVLQSVKGLDEYFNIDLNAAAQVRSKIGTLVSELDREMGDLEDLIAKGTASTVEKEKYSRLKERRDSLLAVQGLDPSDRDLRYWRRRKKHGAEEWTTGSKELYSVQDATILFNGSSRRMVSFLTKQVEAERAMSLELVDQEIDKLGGIPSSDERYLELAQKRAAIEESFNQRLMAIRDKRLPGLPWRARLGNLDTYMRGFVSGVFQGGIAKGFLRGTLYMIDPQFGPSSFGGVKIMHLGKDGSVSGKEIKGIITPRYDTRYYRTATSVFYLTNPSSILKTLFWDGQGWLFAAEMSQRKVTRSLIHFLRSNAYGDDALLEAFLGTDKFKEYSGIAREDLLDKAIADNFMVFLHRGVDVPLISLLRKQKVFDNDSLLEALMGSDDFSKFIGAKLTGKDRNDYLDKYIRDNLAKILRSEHLKGIKGVKCLAQFQRLQEGLKKWQSFAGFLDKLSRPLRGYNPKMLYEKTIGALVSRFNKTTTAAIEAALRKLFKDAAWQATVTKFTAGGIGVTSLVRVGLEAIAHAILGVSIPVIGNILLEAATLLVSDAVYSKIIKPMFVVLADIIKLALILIAGVVLLFAFPLNGITHRFQTSAVTPLNAGSMPYGDIDGGYYDYITLDPSMITGDCPIASDMGCAQGPYGTFSHLPMMQKSGVFAIDITPHGSSTFYAPEDGQITSYTPVNLCTDGKNYGGIIYFKTETVTYRIIHAQLVNSSGGNTYRKGEAIAIMSGPANGVTPGVCWTGPHFHIDMGGINTELWFYGICSGKFTGCNIGNTPK